MDAGGAIRYLAVSPNAWVPLIAADITQQLAQRASYNFNACAADLLYQMGVVSSLETTFGPFSNTSCSARQIAENDRDRDCQCTKGPRTFYFLSARSWEEGEPSRTRTGGFRYVLTTCGVVYRPYVDPSARWLLGGSSLSSAAIAGIVVAAVVVFVALAAAFAFYAFLGGGGRDNRRAPKDASKPFAVVFTDIQCSTALWSRIPSVMSGAVEQHHRVIRRQIGYNGGYEVKTIGDSFMVAFKDVNKAVAFALDVQKYLFAAKWDAEIDATYYELLCEQAGGGNLDRDDGGDDGGFSTSRYNEKDPTQSPKSASCTFVDRHANFVVCHNQPIAPATATIVDEAGGTTNAASPNCGKNNNASTATTRSALN